MRFLFCFFISVFCYSQGSKLDWQLKKDESGIAVYSRKTLNSSFRELKSVAYVKTSLSSIVALLDDWDAYTQWVYKCGESKTIKRISSTELIHYQTVVAPWPAENRDFVVNVKFAQDEKTKIVTIKSVCWADYIPRAKNHVRITEFNACWTLVPMKDGAVQINYQLLVNPGGYVPAWLVNMAAVDGPFETMVHFKEWIVKEKYQKAKISFIKELTTR